MIDAPQSCESEAAEAADAARCHILALMRALSRLSELGADWHLAAHDDVVGPTVVYLRPTRLVLRAVRTVEL